MTQPPHGRYAQVADYLRQQILGGAIEPGAALPSESTLADQFDLSRPTINKAIRVLVAEGLVDVQHGRGSFAREQRPVLITSSSYVTSDGETDRAQWHTELARQGLTGGQRLVSVTTEAPSALVAGYLHLDDDEQVVARRRVMLLADRPVQLADSLYPASLAAGTELSDTGKLAGGTVGALERLGHDLDRFEEHVAARMPTPDEAGQLDMSAGTPVIEHTRVTYDSSGRAIEVTANLLRADQNRLTYVLPAHLH